MKQKVYIVISYPLHSDNGVIMKVHATREGAERYVERNRQPHITLHILKKSVEGTDSTPVEKIDSNKETDIIEISLIHDGSKK